ncbi:MAG TPA: endoribonuclease MazF [Gemmatales bacterium]|nr:endoribonuclease MazF [Gemmatales bacterium]
MAKPPGGSRSGTKAGKTGYIPQAGDLVWLTFTPQAGREQAGRRPGLVLSPLAYNCKTSLCLVCPVTSHAKGYPFEVMLPDTLVIKGVVLADHVRSADWQARQAEYVDCVDSETLAEVQGKLRVLLGL